MSVLSKFLPANYDSTAPVAVIAGRQLYPVLTVAAIRKANVPVRLIAFEGETRQDLVDSFPEEERAVIKVGQIGKMLKSLERLGARYAIMVGQITPGRLFRDLHPDLKAIRMLSSLKERNAATIFGAICDEVTKIGVTILDARSFLDDQLASPGVMTGGKLRASVDTVEHGIRIARAVSELDIGQGVVVRKGTVLAVEAFEGTDDMLSRSNKYKTDGLVFVKIAKPQQDMRYDVPVFGMRTLEIMQEHGIEMACLETDRTLMLEKDKVLERARDVKIQLYGY